MASAARLPIVAPRVGACVRTILVRGIDLTGCTPELQARLAADTPGAPLLDLTSQPAATEGISIGAVVTDAAGVPTTPLVIRINEATLQDKTKVPYMGELGDPGVLVYALVVSGGSVGADRRLIAYGELIALATAFGSDNAPADRVASFQSGDTWGGNNTATIQWDAGTTVQVSVDGADVQAVYLTLAEQALAQSQAAAAEAVASGTVPGALTAEQALLPRQDLFRPDRAIVGQYYNPFSGTLSNDPAEFCTHKIPLLAGQAAIWSSMTIGAGIGRISFWDAAGAFAGSNETIANFPATVAPYAPIPVPANARSFGLSGPTIQYGATASANYNPDLKIFAFDPGGAQERGYGRLMSAGQISPVSGLFLSCLGDSRGDPQAGNLNPWLRICRSVDAHAGITIAGQPGQIDTALAGRRLAKALFRRDDTTALVAQDFANIAAVFLALGCNDAANGLPVGDPTDLATANTVYGHLLRIVTALIGFNDFMRVVIVTPYYRSDTPLAIQQAYAEAYRNFGKLNNVQVFDHFVDSQIGPLNAATLLGDGVHASDDGKGGGGMNFAVVNAFVGFIRHRMTPPIKVAYESSNALTI